MPFSHKKEEKTKKENYRPVSILPSVSKMFETNMYEDINQFMNTKLSSYLCGFRIDYSIHHCLMIILQKWKKALDKAYRCAGALLTDLSKAFDCTTMSYSLLSLKPMDLVIHHLTLNSSYLSDRKQRTKVNNIHNEWPEIKTGIPQGSILGPFLFNMYINDIFYFVNEERITNYADDITTYIIDNNIENLLT